MSKSPMKKRKISSSSSMKVEVKQEYADNDYQMAKGRLKGVLKQLAERSESDGSESEGGDYRHYKGDSSSKRKDHATLTPFHHTYVMKLFDRSVDLARFEEDTPLYPICRAWMQNQPRNPQYIVKRRYSSPEPDSNSWINSTDVTRLPRPSAPFVTRVPSPLPEQEQNKDNINLNYDENPPVDKDVLIKNHLQRWVKVKRKWIQTATKNEDRYYKSFQILQNIYNKAQENME